MLRECLAASDCRTACRMPRSLRQSHRDSAARPKAVGVAIPLMMAMLPITLACGGGAIPQAVSGELSVHEPDDQGRHDRPLQQGDEANFQNWDDGHQLTIAPAVPHLGGQQLEGDRDQDPDAGQSQPPAPQLGAAAKYAHRQATR